MENIVIKCPKCNAEFSPDTTGFTNLCHQIEDNVLKKEQLIWQEKLALEKQNLENKLILELNNSKQNEIQKINEKNAELVDKQKKVIEELKTKIEVYDLETNLRIAKEKESLVMLKQQEINEINLSNTKVVENLKNAKNELEIKLKTKEAQTDIELTKIKSNLELKIKELENKVLEENKKYNEDLNNQKVLHQYELKLKDDHIKRVEDYRIALSTKAIGDSLEVYCENQYEQFIRSFLNNAKFYKDTLGSSKGDYIFEEFDEFGKTKLVSIMFDMKNQESLNETKSKNKEHYPKLNNDRVNKKCEYAVLVSTLEPDNENFNQGIVKVPGYDKMYVVRPQFFLTIIGLIRDASFGVAHYKTEITKYKEINLDVTNFEDRLNDFQDKFHKNVESAKKRHSNAIDEIDKAIAKLQKAKEELLGSSAQLNLADDKAQGLTIRKLTHNNKTLKEAFKKVNEDENSSPES